MSKELLYTTALDYTGRIILIEDAKKGLRYFCPICKNEFILRKSGKTGKGSRRSHFAHNELTANCTPESVLHYSFKKILLEILERYRVQNRELKIEWSCNFCYKKHYGNLLEKVIYIKEEYYLSDCRPDIALLDSDKNVIAVIEIVVKHKPEEKIIKYYKNNNIILIIINVSSEDNLKEVEEKVKIPDLVNYCLNPICQIYNNNLNNRKIMIINDICQRCFSKIERYYISINSIFGNIESFNFLDDEIEKVKAHRNNIEVKLNNDNNDKYPAFVCINCKRLQSRYGRHKF